MDIEELIARLRIPPYIAPMNMADLEAAADILERISKLPGEWEDMAEAAKFDLGANGAAAVRGRAIQLRATWEQKRIRETPA